MRRRDDWLAFWVTLLTIALAYFLSDRETIRRYVSKVDVSLDFGSVLTAVLVIAGVYTLLSVVHHIIHVRED
jgi:hypothetical protein